MKTSLGVALLLVAMTSLASAAETYSFTTTTMPGAFVSGQVPGGRVVAGGVSTYENTSTTAAGKKMSSKGTCAAWSAQPGETLATHGVCDGDGEAGKVSVFFSCSPVDPKTGISSCWGALRGVSGTYAGKNGSATWQNKSAGPGKGSTGTGSGVWND